MAFKTTTPPASALALIAALAAAFAMPGCSKDKGDGEEKEIAPFASGPVVYAPGALVLQVSEKPVVYIWQSPQDDAMREGQRVDDYDSNTFIVMPSVLADVPSQLEYYKTTREIAGKRHFVLLTGDDLAPCDSIIRIIDCAKRSGIELIFFETIKRETGIGFHSNCPTPGWNIGFYHHPYPYYFDFKSDPKYARKIVTITISANETIAWDRKQGSLEEFIKKLYDHSLEVGPENAAIVVEVDAEANYSTLRYVLDQIRRCGISKVMVCQRPAK